MAETPQNDYEQEALTPEQLEQKRQARRTITHMYQFISSKIEAVRKEGSDEERQFLLDSIDRIQQLFIEWSTKDNPMIETVWQEVTPPQKPISESPEPRNQPAEMRGKLLRVREAVANYLGEEGLERFNEAMETEMRWHP